MECGLYSYQIRGQSIMFIVQQHYGCAVRIPYTSALPVTFITIPPTYRKIKGKTNQKNTEYLITARFLHKKKRLK